MSRPTAKHRKAKIVEGLYDKLSRDDIDSINVNGNYARSERFDLTINENGTYVGTVF